MNNRYPQQKQGNQNNLAVTQQKSEFFSGPLPHPDILRKFNEVILGSAERILKMAEEQSLHRKSLEDRVITNDIARSKWGQILGFIITIFGLSVSGLVAIFGNAIAGSILGVGTLVSLVSVFMYGSKTRSEEREIKNVA